MRPPKRPLKQITITVHHSLAFAYSLPNRNFLFKCARWPYFTHAGSLSYQLKCYDDKLTLFVWRQPVDVRA